VAAIAENPERAEHRWPAAGAVVVALTLYALLPSSFLPPLRIAVIVTCLLLLIPVIALNPVRFNRQTAWSRRASIAGTVVLAIANHVALGQLVVQLVQVESDADGSLLLAATQVWITHVIVYALIYWEMDRGGPVIRSTAKRADLPLADVRFPQDEDHDAIAEVAAGSSAKVNWTPSFVDYAYLSLTSTMAFAPPDAMPLRARTKVLVGLQSFAGFVILVLVIARAVSLRG
jgi:Ca2+/H+ antiporter